MAEDKFDALMNALAPAETEEDQEQGLAAALQGKSPEVEPEPIDKQADELGSQYWQGMDYKDAVAEYERLKELPNAEVETFSGMLKYTDTVTGRQELVPRPVPGMFRATFDAAKKLVQAPFSEDVSVQDAADAFTNPPATTSGMDLLQMGIRESMGGAEELGAAALNKAGVISDETLDSVTANNVSVDTEDSFIDSAIADGGPALIAAILGDKGASKIKYLPDFARNVARVLTAETAATGTLSTDEGTLVLGEDAAIPLAEGLDLGDSKSDAIIEQRANSFIEAMGLTSLLAGAGRTAADAGTLLYDMTLRPVFRAIGPQSQREKVVFDDISNRLASITDATTEEERFQIVKGIAETIEANKDVVINRIDASKEDLPLQLDTMSALIRGIDDPAMAAEARKLIAGMNTKVMPKFTEAINRPKAEMEQEVKDYLASVDAETTGQQTAAMQDVADNFADQANQYIDEAVAPARNAEAEYNQAIENLGTGISEDLEFADRLKELENITGTEITKAKDGKLQDVMDGVRLGYEDLKNQKNMLYAEISGGEIDPDALFDKLYDLNDDQISAALANVRRSNPIRNLLDVINTKSVPDIDPDTGKEIMRPPTMEERRKLFVDLLEGQGADFGYIYTTIRPELSALASDLYEQNPGAGRVVRDLVRFIDEDMVNFVEASDPELAEAAKAAKAFYKDTYAPIFSGEGVMARYANLYDRTIGRTGSDDLVARTTGTELDRSGYDQGVEELSKNIFNSGNVASAAQLAEALKVASDPNAMADYMVLDVLDQFASKIRIEGLDASNLTGMSAALQKYASQMNELFPEKAAQLNTFIKQIEEAAKSRGSLDAILPNLEATVKQARDDVAATELMGFLRTELGNDAFLPTTNPQTAFDQLFNSKESLASLENIKLSVNSLPPGQREMVQRGLEVAYLRRFQTKTSDFRMEVSGITPLKDASVAKMQQEFDQTLAQGRVIFSDKPEVAEALEQYLEVAGAVQANRNARTNIGLSPTAFLQEATTATNRLIFTLIGPLSRAGTRVRALSGAAFDKLGLEQRAMQIYDEILSNPDKFLELARRYNRQPNDKVAQDALTRMLTSATIRTTSATDREDLPTTVDGVLDYAEPYINDANDAIQSIDQQMQNLQ